MRRLAILICFMTIGCEQPLPDSDGGTAHDGGRDAGPITMCARDRDCSDGLFCNGQERCIPGEPGADARGCVTIQPPCVPEVCDEEADQCSICQTPDRDDDGHIDEACGGDDCDDTREDVFGGGVEVCDSEGVNEDCIDETLGTDADGDGFYDPACCFQPDDGSPLICGNDCDDADRAINPDAPERCNGVDDDCDGAIDEDFECVQSQVVSGTNACGREGQRRCGATCEWLDDGFVRAESASSCDYCDDSGDGLGEEIPFATVMNHRTEIDDGWASYGDAGVEGLCTFGCPWSIVNAPSERGALYIPTPLTLGYGPTYVRATVQTRATSADPNGMWSLVILAGPPVSWLGPVGSSMYPSGDGFVVTWGFNTFFPPSLTLQMDRMYLGRLHSAGLDSLGATEMGVDEDQDGPAGTVVEQTIWIEINSDDPRTSADETTLYVIGPIGTGLGCGPDSAIACGLTLRPGTPLHVGVVADAPAADSVQVTGPRIAVTRSGICEP